jgi:hypothetical protein
MKLGGSLGNVPQKLKKKTCYKSSIYFLVSLCYCEYVPSSAITNIPFHYRQERTDLYYILMIPLLSEIYRALY